MIHAYLHRQDGAQVGIAWEVYEDYQDDFRPVAHIRYADGDSPYPNDEYTWWAPSTVTSGGVYHTLDLRCHTVGSGVEWDAYVDGNYYEDFWYPYPTGQMAESAVEVAHTLTSSDNYFMGRNKDVYLRKANGQWALLNTTWAGKVAWGVYGASPDYYISWNSQYYDWQARR